MFHVLQRRQVDAEHIRDARHVKSKLHEQVDEVHLLAGERIADLWTGGVALWPGALIDTPVSTLRCVVLLDVVHVVSVELERCPTMANAVSTFDNDDRLVA